MRTPGGIVAALLALLALLTGALASAQSADGWSRIRHPALPLSLDLPEDTSYQEVRSFGLGSPRRKDAAPLRLGLFGVRPLDERHLRFHAVEIALFWLTDEIRGVEAESLRAMPRLVRDAERTEQFLRGVLYRGPVRVTFEDHGVALVGGMPSRRAALSRVTAPGTPDERTVEGEVYLVTRSAESALVIVARVDPKASAHEREVLLPRIVQSIRFRESDTGPVHARRDGGAGA